MKNESGIKVTGWTVLALPDEVENKTEGGIYMPDTTKEKEDNAQVMATIVAVGSMAFFDKDRWNADEKAELRTTGTRIIMARYAGIFVPPDWTKDGRRYRIINDADVAGIIE